MKAERMVLESGIEVLMTDAAFGELVSRLEKPKFDPDLDADAIVNGDRDLLGIGVYEGVPILTPAEFLVRVRR